jgi:hypothetical protein
MVGQNAARRVKKRRGVDAMPSSRVGISCDGQSCDDNNETDNDATEHARSSEAVPAAQYNAKTAGNIRSVVPQPFTSSRVTPRRAPSGFLLHVLDAGKDDALGALFGVAEVELVLGKEYRIAIDVIGDAGTVGRNKSVQLPVVFG